MLPILFLLGATYVVQPSNYTPLRGYDWQYCYGSTATIPVKNTHYTINYTYCSHNNAIQKEFIETNIVPFSQIVLNYILSQNLSLYNQCRPNDKLEIYDVEMHVLNDWQRFNEWQANSNLKEIWALYDKRRSERGLSAIVLTDHDAWTKVTFAHELSHYWYDRFCLDPQYNYEPEMFAMNFQKYYVENYYD